MAILTSRGGSKRPKPVCVFSDEGGALAGHIADRLRPGNVFAPHPSDLAEFIPLLPLYGELAEDDCYFQLVRDVAGLEMTGVGRFPGVAFDPQAIFQAIRNEPRGIHRIVWELMLRAGEYYQATAVLDRSAGSLDHAARLAAVFPDMAFINLCGTASRAAQDLDRNYPDRVLTILPGVYRASEARSLYQICDFLRLRFSTEMLDGDYAGEPAHGDGERRRSRQAYLTDLRDYMGDAC